jgi:hypothetical protein
MPFFVEKSQDQFGNRLYTNSPPRIIEAEYIDDGDGLRVIVPDEGLFPWRNLRSRFWIECPGPAREVSHDKREQIFSEATEKK